MNEMDFCCSGFVLLVVTVVVMHGLHKFSGYLAKQVPVWREEARKKAEKERLEKIVQARKEPVLTKEERAEAFRKAYRERLALIRASDLPPEDKQALENEALDVLEEQLRGLLI